MIKKAIAAAVAAVVSTAALSFTQPHNQDWVVLGDYKYTGSYLNNVTATSGDQNGYGLVERWDQLPGDYRISSISKRDQLVWVAALSGLAGSINNFTPINGNIIVDLGSMDFFTNPTYGMTVVDFKANYKVLIETIVGTRTDLNATKVWCVVPTTIPGQSMGLIDLGQGPVHIYFGNGNYTEPMNAYGETHDQYQEAVREVAAETGLCTLYAWDTLGTGMFFNSNVTASDWTTDAYRMTSSGMDKLWIEAHRCHDGTQNAVNDCTYQDSPPWWLFDGFHNPSIVHYY